MRQHSRARLWVSISMVSLLTLAVAGSQENEKHVLAAALDKDGTPIVGLMAEHFAIRESGRDRTVIKVEPLQIPMHVAVLVDTSIANGSPDETFRSAVVAFVQRLAASNHVAVYSFGDRAARVASFAQEPAKIGAAATGMFGWSHQRSHLIDVIDLCLRDFESIESPRPVIIAITSESPEASGQTAGGVIKTAHYPVGRVSRDLARGRCGHQGAGVEQRARSGAGKQQAPRRDGRGRRGGPRTQSGVAAGDVGDGRRAPPRSEHARAGACAGPRGQRVSNAFKVTFDAARVGRKMQDLQVGLLVEGVTLRATAAPFGTR